MTLSGDAARCRAGFVAALWGGWGAELEFWREGFDELWRDALDGDEVFRGADWVCGAGGYDSLGNLFANAGEGLEFLGGGGVRVDGGGGGAGVFEDCLEFGGFAAFLGAVGCEMGPVGDGPDAFFGGGGSEFEVGEGVAVFVA
jgi:hypothetical protein